MKVKVIGIQATFINLLKKSPNLTQNYQFFIVLDQKFWLWYSGLLSFWDPVAHFKLYWTTFITKA